MCFLMATDCFNIRVTPKKKIDINSIFIESKKKKKNLNFKFVSLIYCTDSIIRGCYSAGVKS